MVVVGPTEFTCACWAKCQIFWESIGAGALQPFEHCAKDEEHLRYIGEPIVLLEERDGNWIEVHRWKKAS